MPAGPKLGVDITQFDAFVTENCTQLNDGNHYENIKKADFAKT